MSSGITTQIIIRPYLKDYFIHKYGQGSHPVPATTRNKLFPFLYQYLSKVPADYRPMKDTDNKVLSFELPYSDMLNIKYNNYIHPNHYGEIQSFLYGIFYNDFTFYMRMAWQREHLPIKNAVIAFCLENNISFDKANYDSLRRIFLRSRSNIKTKKMSPGFRGVI